MEEAAGNAVSEVRNCLAAPIGRQFMYLFNYKSNFDNLEKEIGKLKGARDEVKDKVVAAEKNVEKIKPKVKDWQRDVDSIIDEAEKLIQEKTNGRCFNLIACYKNSRKASKMVEAVTEILQEKETFSEVSLPTTYEDIRLTNRDYEEFESRLSALNDVLNAVEDAKVGIIGVYGMGGIGKTTVVKEAKKKQLLDEVVFIEVGAEDEAKDKRMKGCPEEGDSKITEQNNNKSNNNNNKETSGDTSKENSKVSEVQKPDYIHVRARRGQATDSHSLAERVRREKISERMKYLQDLVPGCNKITGKVVMLDQIINYVQSLQRQVEFLSMKLAAVNPRPDFNIDNFFAKEVFPACPPNFPPIGLSSDMNNPAYLQFNPVQQVVSCSGLKMRINPSDMRLRRTISAPISIPETFLASL